MSNAKPARMTKTVIPANAKPSLPSDEIAALRRRVAELEKQMKWMRCCENCKNEEFEYDMHAEEWVQKYDVVCKTCVDQSNWKPIPPATGKVTE